jgi:hypothetical protein
MKRAHERSARVLLSSARYWPAFNLFRHKLTSDLICAVPEDYPVPGFLNASTWTFTGKASEPTTIPRGFRSKAAETGVRLSGFYLFQTSPIDHDRITVASRTEQTQPAGVPNLLHECECAEDTPAPISPARCDLTLGSLKELL